MLSHDCHIFRINSKKKIFSVYLFHFKYKHFWEFQATRIGLILHIVRDGIRNLQIIYKNIEYKTFLIPVVRLKP